MQTEQTARERGRRLTLEIPALLYARLAVIKAMSRKSLSALAEEGLELIVARYSAPPTSATQQER